MKIVLQTQEPKKLYMIFNLVSLYICIFLSLMMPMK